MIDAIALYNKAHQNPCWCEISFWIENNSKPLSLDNKPCVFIAIWQEIYLYKACEFYCKHINKKYSFTITCDDISSEYGIFQFVDIEKNAFLGTLYYVMHVHRDPKDNVQKAFVYHNLCETATDVSIYDLLRFMYQTFSCVLPKYKPKNEIDEHKPRKKVHVMKDLQFYDKHFNWGNFVFKEEVDLEDLLEQNPLYEFYYKLFLKEVNACYYGPFDFIQIISAAFYYSLIIRMSNKADLRWPNIERDLFAQMRVDLSGDEEKLGFAIPLMVMMCIVYSSTSEAAERFKVELRATIMKNRILANRISSLVDFVKQNFDVQYNPFIAPYNLPLLKRLIEEHGAYGIYVYLRHCETADGKINEYLDNAIKDIFKSCKGDKECLDYYYRKFCYAVFGKGEEVYYNRVFLQEIISDACVFSSENLQESARIKKKLLELNQDNVNIQTSKSDVSSIPEKTTKRRPKLGRPVVSLLDCIKVEASSKEEEDAKKKEIIKQMKKESETLPDGPSMADYLYDLKEVKQVLHKYPSYNQLKVAGLTLKVCQSTFNSNMRKYR